MTSFDQAELARALFEEIGDALFLLDPDSDRLIEVNPVVLRLTGFTRPEVLRFPATYLFRFEPSGGLQRLRGAFTKTMVFHNQDGYLLRTKEDGVWIPVNLTVSRLHVPPRPLGLIIARDDRDRRAAFAQARRVEAELRKVLSSSPAALWSAERAPGPDVLAGWQFRYVSPLLARIAGRPADYFDHPFRWAEVIHAHDRDDYRSAVRRLLTGSEAEAEQAYRVSAADGSVRWVRDRLQAIRDDSGRPVRLDGCLVDTTAQRQAEEALRQSEQRFEKSRDGVVLIDERGTITYVSPAARSVSGYEPGALLGTDAFEQVHPDDRAAARDRLRYALAHPGEDVPWQCRGFDAHGAVRVYELNLCNRLDDPSVRAVVVNYRDVTEREHAAAELARHDALLGGLFDSIPDVICYEGRDLKFLGGNPAFEELAGRPTAEMVGLGCEDVFQDEWAARLLVAEREVIATGRTIPGRDWVTYPDGRKALLDILLSMRRAGRWG